MSSPEQRRTTIEALFAQSTLGQDFQKLRAALGSARDKNSVIRIASDVLESDPVDANGKVLIGGFEFGFDVDDNLEFLSNRNCGIAVDDESPNRR